MFIPCAADRSRGFTLVEVLVSMFLSSLILYVLIALLFPAMRLSGKGTARVDIDQRAAVTEQRIIRALKSTNRAGVLSADVPAGHLLSVHPLYGALADSKQDWAKALTIFAWKGQSLTVYEMPLPPPAPVRATTPTPQTLLAGLSSSRVKFTVDGVSRFTSKVGLGPEVSFEFVMEKGKERLEVKRTVFLVNSSQ